MLFISIMANYHLWAAGHAAYTAEKQGLDNFLAMSDAHNKMSIMSTANQPIEVEFIKDQLLNSV